MKIKVFYTLRKKGTKAVTGAVPFQAFVRVHIGTIMTMKVPICTL